MQFIKMIYKLYFKIENKPLKKKFDMYLPKNMPSLLDQIYQI